MTEQKQKTTNYRISSAPVVGSQGDVYPIAASAAGEARPILPYIRTTHSVPTAEVVGILICAATAAVVVRGDFIGVAAGNTGKGITIAAGTSLYIPKPTDGWGAESAAECYVAMFY
jgi:hypothetical protein